MSQGSDSSVRRPGWRESAPGGHGGALEEGLMEDCALYDERKLILGRVSHGTVRAGMWNSWMAGRALNTPLGSGSAVLAMGSPSSVQ